MGSSSTCPTIPEPSGGMMADRLLLDYNNMLVPAVGAHGIEPADLDGIADRVGAIVGGLEGRRAAGELGFLDLPGQRPLVDQIRAFGEGVGQAFDTILVLGIGGSALGTLALQHALLPPHWNELDDEAREYFPRLYVLDNVDPTTIGPFLDRLDLRRVLVNVISKSGATAETMAQFLVVRDRMMALFGDEYRTHFIFTTDPEKGVLRRIADDESIPTLPVPPNVGGRFSVLSAVGLLPAALVGIDINLLLDGAARMAERCRATSLRENPAALFGTLQYLAQTARGANVHVMMPYSDRLYGMADWFRQLWAESLGKKLSIEGAEVFRGPTPVKALGATDQHSQAQLYMEGPFDKTVTLLAARDRAIDVAIPEAYPDIDAIAYLGGQSLGRLIDAERRATAGALARAGRMSMTIELPAIDAGSIGELIMMLEIATVVAGALYGVNPLDQPGVELGKVLTYGLMGRPGFPPPDDAAPAQGNVCA
jgi:glucose-6-phosphate isomerase